MLLSALCTSLQGAIIRGAVVENITGKALSRTTVTVQPIGGSGGPALKAITNSNGGFEFTALRAGAYIVTASRKNFSPVQYGQKDFRSAGLPILLDEPTSTFLNIRLPRLGVVAGRVVDENDVGLPNHDVVIYRDIRPPLLLQRIPADERGIYRFFGLDPGSYLIRTVAREYDEGSYLPTFSKEAEIVEEARPVEVALDQEALNIDVRPKQGRLYKIEGVVLPGMPIVSGPMAGMPVTVKLTFATEMGREETETSSAFRFNPVPPGDYEFYAEGPGDGSFQCAMIGGYMPIHVKDKDLLNIQVPVPCVRETSVLINDSRGQRINTNGLQLLARRRDMTGTTEARALPVNFNRVLLPPGRWEVMLRPPAGYCVVGFSYSGSRSDGLEKNRPDGWNEMLAGLSSTIRFTLSSSPGGMHGLVSGIAKEPVAGAPVYLEGYDPDLRKRVTELQVALTDSRGMYQFKGLAPGTYRVLASFEFQRPDAIAMEYAGAKTIKIIEAQDLPQDLDLSVLR